MWGSNRATTSPQPSGRAADAATAACVPQACTTLIRWASSRRLSDAEHGFAYLGYWFDKKHGAPRARPTRENLREFESKLERHYCRIVDGLVMNGRVWPPDLRKIDALLNCIRGWANGFSCWPYARKWAERRLRHYLFLPPGDLRTRVIEHFGGIATPSSRAA